MNDGMNDEVSTRQIVISVDQHGKASGDTHVEIPKGIQRIQWVLFGDFTQLDVFTGIQLYEDAAKTVPANPAYFQKVGGRYGFPSDAAGLSAWNLDFLDEARVGKRQTLWYTLTFSRNFWHGDSWDPTLEIDPRGIGGGPGWWSRWWSSLVRLFSKAG